MKVIVYDKGRVFLRRDNVFFWVGYLYRREWCKAVAAAYGVPFMEFPVQGWREALNKGRAGPSRREAGWSWVFDSGGRRVSGGRL